MLILTRKEDESITITVPPSDSETKVRLKSLPNSFSKRVVRLGFDAPESVSILRDELTKSTHKEEK